MSEIEVGDRVRSVQDSPGGEAPNNDWFVFIPNEERRAFESAYEKMRLAQKELIEVLNELRQVVSS